MRLRRTTLLMVGLAAILLGIGASALTGTQLGGVWLFIAITFVVISLRSRGAALLMSVGLLGLVIGWLRGDVFMQRLIPYEDLAGQKVVVVVRAEGDAAYDNRRQLAFDGQNVRIIEPDYMELPGRLKISGFGAPSVQRGDEVQVEGKLYRTRGSRQASINFAELKVLEPNESKLDRVRREFVAGTTTALPEPHASFGLGLLIGQRNNLPELVTDQLSTTGLTHIIAVSGYNLTIIIGFVRRLTAKRSKYQTVLIAAALTSTFLLFTGFSASIVRAAVVSGLSLLAWYYGRSMRPVLLLLVAAALTAMWYPPYLWSDIGWHLSFLAFYGVLVLAPLVTRKFFKRPPKLVGGVVIESFCAQVMTWPLVLFIFGQSSSVALLSNALIVPLVPLAMLFSLVAGLGGMLAPSIASWFALPARIILTYILDAVRIFSEIPNARINRGVSLSGMVVLYTALVIFSIVLWRRTRLRRDTITDVNPGV